MLLIVLLSFIKSNESLNSNDLTIMVMSTSRKHFDAYQFLSEIQYGVALSISQPVKSCLSLHVPVRTRLHELRLIYPC